MREILATMIYQIVYSYDKLLDKLYFLYCLHKRRNQIKIIDITYMNYDQRDVYHNEDRDRNDSCQIKDTTQICNVQNIFYDNSIYKKNKLQLDFSGDCRNRISDSKKVVKNDNIKKSLKKDKINNQSVNKPVEKLSYKIISSINLPPSVNEIYEDQIKNGKNSKYSWKLPIGLGNNDSPKPPMWMREKNFWLNFKYIFLTFKRQLEKTYKISKFEIYRNQYYKAIIKNFEKPKKKAFVLEERTFKFNDLINN